MNTRAPGEIEAVPSLGSPAAQRSGGHPRAPRRQPSRRRASEASRWRRAPSVVKEVCDDLGTITAQGAYYCTVLRDSSSCPLIAENPPTHPDADIKRRLDGMPLRRNRVATASPASVAATSPAASTIEVENSLLLAALETEDGEDCEAVVVDVVKSTFPDDAFWITVTV